MKYLTKKKVSLFIFTFLLLNVFVSIHSVCAEDEVEYVGVREGQVLIWKIESEDGTNFLKANISHVSANSIHAHQYEYNRFGMKIEEFTNTSIELIRSNFTFSFIISQFGQTSNKTIDVAGRETLVVAISDSNVSKVYFDYQTGILCLSESENGSITLVSWVDAEITSFVNFIPIIAGVIGGVVALIAIIVVVKKKKKNKSEF